jgi:hypothetical protein
MPRKVISKKVAARGRTKKAPPKLTNEEILEFLEKMRAWWKHLGGDIGDLETTVTRAPFDVPPSAEVNRKYRALIKMVRLRPYLGFPFVPTKICLWSGKVGPKAGPRKG